MPERRAAGIEAIARDDAGDVRAVPVVVVRRRAPVDEIDELVDALRSGGSLREVVVPASHAGVDHRDAYARPVIPIGLPNAGRTHGRPRPLRRARDHAVQYDALHERAIRQNQQREIRDVDHHGVDEGKRATKDSADLLDEGADRPDRREVDGAHDDLGASGDIQEAPLQQRIELAERQGVGSGRRRRRKKRELRFRRSTE